MIACWRQVVDIQCIHRTQVTRSLLYRQQCNAPIIFSPHLLSCLWHARSFSLFQRPHYGAKSRIPVLWLDKKKHQWERKVQSWESPPLSSLCAPYLFVDFYLQCENTIDSCKIKLKKRTERFIQIQYFHREHLYNIHKLTNATFI